MSGFVIVPDGGLSASLAAQVRKAALGVTQGTSFPSSPSVNDKFYRTDRNVQYYFDGARWLSTDLMNLVFVPDVANPKTATFTSRAPNPHFGVHSIYVVQFVQTAYVSATTAANYFVSQLASKLGAASTNIGTALSTQNVTINTHTAQSTAPNVVVASTEAVFEVTATETGTCTAFLAHSLNYRIIG